MFWKRVSVLASLPQGITVLDDNMLELSKRVFVSRFESYFLLQCNDFLKKLIESDVDLSVKLDCINKIDDDDFLFNLFKKSNSYAIKSEIIENLTNHEYILELYLESQWHLRKKLIKFDFLN